MKGLMLVSLSNDADLWARFKLSFFNIATSVVILCGSMSTEFLDQDESEFQVRVSLKYYFFPDLFIYLTRLQRKKFWSNYLMHTTDRKSVV